MYRNLENIDQRIIDEFVKQSAENGITNTTARTISKALGISDFTIFSHFQTIEGLRRSAYSYVVNKIVEEEIQIGDQIDSATKLFDWLFDYFMRNPNETLFYKEALPMIGFTPQKMEGEYPRYLKFVKNYIPISEGMNDSECLLVFDFILNTLINYASRVVKGEFQNVKSFRQIIKRLVFNSLIDDVV